MVRIRLTHKFAERLNGVDLSHLHVGDISDLPSSAAAMLISEGWAEPVAAPGASTRADCTTAAKSPPVI